MKNKFERIILFVTLLFAAAMPATAWPILSADGSLLSGLDVDGVSYDVHFGDTIPMNWDLLNPDWYQFVPVLNLALANALNGLGAVGSDISGCQSNACTLFIADSLFIAPMLGYAYYDRNPAIFDGSSWAVSSNQVSLGSASGPPQPDPATTSTLTLATITRSVQVPEPAMLSLIGLGTVVLAFRRKRQERVKLLRG
jgi:hypothetical protein